jgi:hypothetical protein
MSVFFITANGVVLARARPACACRIGPNWRNEEKKGILIGPISISNAAALFEHFVSLSADAVYLILLWRR